MTRPVPEELISAYFDGEVTPEERNEIERLLDSSSELRQQLDDTSKLSALLHSFPREAAPEEIMTRVQQRVARVSMPPQVVPVEVQASACPDSTEVPAVTGSPVSSPSTIPTRRSLRREWIAFGAGTMATMASLLLCVTWNRSQTASEREGNRALVESSAKTRTFGTKDGIEGTGTRTGNRNTCSALTWLARPRPLTCRWAMLFPRD